MSTAWSLFVIALTLFNLLGVTWLLWWTAKRRPGDPKPEETSHYWDEDITEYNKPMPCWWINGFYLSIVFGFAYLFWYGGWGSFDSMSGWSSAGEHQADKVAADAQLEETFAPYRNRALPDLASNPQALQLGRSIFANTCATCHGSSAQGAIGYPDLSDTIWHWGGAPEQVLQTVLHGRHGVMPPWGQMLTGMGGATAVDDVIAYVRSLSANTRSSRVSSAVKRGEKLYAGVCVACHAADGKGNMALGAPDLTDDYWLYGNSDESLRLTINDGRQGTMPAHAELLGETRARLAAAYVWSLSNPPTTANADAHADKLEQ